MVTIEEFGTLDDRQVHRATLQSDRVALSIVSLGCITQDWRVDGIPVVLGLNSVEDYLAHSKSFGVIAGRVANRIAGGRFLLGGTDYQLPLNHGPNHLHGGPGGLGNRIWQMESGDNAVRLTYHSPDGEEGYPGAVDFTVTIALDDTKVSYEMTGRPDRPTPINLAQHNYYNLNGHGDVRGHTLWVPADTHTETDAALIPTGRILPVEGSVMDFRSPRTIAAADPGAIGMDGNLVLRADLDRAELVATVSADNSPLRLRLWSDEPGLQLFDAPLMDIPVPGVNGERYGPFAGLCLEAQHFPDAVNHPHFPPIIRDPDNPYVQRYIVDIA